MIEKAKNQKIEVNSSELNFCKLENGLKTVTEFKILLKNISKSLTYSCLKGIIGQLAIREKNVLKFDYHQGRALATFYAEDDAINVYRNLNFKEIKG